MNYHRFLLSAVTLLLAATQLLAFCFFSPFVSGQIILKEDRPAQTQRQRQGVERFLKNHEGVSLDSRAAAQRLRSEGRLTIKAESKSFELELAPHNLRGLNYQAVDRGAGGMARPVEMKSLTTYRGRDLATGGEARFTVDEGNISGLVISAGEIYFVEPLRKFEPAARATDFVLYKGSDVYADEEQCGGDEEEGGGAAAAVQLTTASDTIAAAPPLARQVSEEFSRFGVEARSQQITAGTSAATQSYREIEIATEADYEYVTAAGGAAAANNEILSLLNGVEGIYQAELGLTLKVVYQHTWSDPNDPYTTGDVVALLEEEKNWWNANQGGVARDVVHLWTGRDVYRGSNYSTAGLAYSQLIVNGVTSDGVVCRVSNQYSYGLTERLANFGSRVRVTAHEIGHNLSATHSDGVAGCDNTIMAATSGPSSQLTFCQYSRDQITAYVSTNGSCLSSVTVSDPGPTNPIDDAATFVRQQYLDFLSREPDGSGFSYWTGEINACGGEPNCVDAKRVNTSGAFFLSTEFQSTGYFVYRLYQGALARPPQFTEFLPDQQGVARGIVVGNQLSDQNIENNKNAFAAQFATRAEFRGTYDGLGNQGFVDELFRRTGANVSDAERAGLVGGLDQGTETRPSVLRKILDGTTTVNNGELRFTTSYGQEFYNKVFNPAFVTMQYFGYLRRDVDPGGYQFWLDKLNAYGNYKDAEMVRSFIISDEYRRRFGQP